MKNAKVSYVKKPFARHSFPALGLTVCALALGAAGMLYSIGSDGQIPLNMAAVCLCSLIVAVSGLIFGVRSLFEKEKKYILAQISLAVCGILVVVWLVMIIIGLRG